MPGNSDHFSGAGSTRRACLDESMPGQIESLTSIRFVMALLVVMYHFAPRESAPSAIRNLIANGYFGVSFLFVLSGFILAWRYRALVEKTRFWQARFAWIYPVYFLALCIAIPARIHDHTGGQLAGGILGSASLLNAWRPSTWNFVNEPGWAVSAECALYILFPFVIPSIKRVAASRLWLLSTIGIAMVPLAQSFLGRDATPFQVYTPIFHVPQFAIGAIFGSRVAQFGASSLMNRAGSISAVGIAIVLLSLLSGKKWAELS